MDRNFIKGVQLGMSQGMTAGGATVILLGLLFSSAFLIGCGLAWVIAGAVGLWIWNKWYK